MTKTYSSVREALESGILESGHAHRLNQRGRSQFRSQSYTLATAECQSNSIHAVDTRLSMSSSSQSSSFLESVREDTIAIEGLRLSSNPSPQEIDLSEMTSEDIERLKVEDPFMYYSIPEKHSRFYNNFGNDDDAPMIPEDPEGRGTATAAADGVVGADDGAAPPPPSSSSSNSNFTNNRRPPRTLPTPLHASCPAGMLANAEIALASGGAVPPPERRSSVVRKCRRLSVEQHPMLMCRDFLRRVSDPVMSEEGQIGGGAEEREEEEEEENLLLSALTMDLSDGDDDSEYDFDMSMGDDA